MSSLKSLAKERPSKAPDKSETDATSTVRLIPGLRVPLSDQLYGQLLSQIVSGVLKEEEQLPAEREICEMFEVSRPVVREALMRLRADGLIHTRQGARSFVISRPAARLAEFANAEAVGVMLRCIEVRIPLEGWAAKLAAQRRTPAQLAKITAAFATFESEIESGALTSESDFAFHASIAAASGNEFFLSMLQNIRSVLTGFMTLSLKLTSTGSQDRARHVLSEHAAILEAIRGEDGDMAEVAMQFHIGTVQGRMINRNRDR